MAKRRADRRQLDFYEPEFKHCEICQDPASCAAGKCPCKLVGEFMAGPLRGKLPCEVQGPPIPVYFNNHADTTAGC